MSLSYALPLVAATALLALALGIAIGMRWVPRLNERRESLARRAPLMMVLPKTWTRNAALCAPDSWTVRLTSLYLQPLPPATDAHTEVPVTRPLSPETAPETTGTLTAAHHRILRQWVQAIDTGQTHRMVTSDGWAAVQASLLLGDSTQALLLANAVLELAYQRGLPPTDLETLFGHVLHWCNEYAQTLRQADALADMVVEELRRRRILLPADRKSVV